MARWPVGPWLAVTVFVSALSGVAQGRPSRRHQDDEDRIQRLEDRVQTQQEEIDDLLRMVSSRSSDRHRESRPESEDEEAPEREAASAALEDPLWKLTRHREYYPLPSLHGFADARAPAKARRRHRARDREDSQELAEEDEEDAGSKVHELDDDESADDIDSRGAGEDAEQAEGREDEASPRGGASDDEDRAADSDVEEEVPFEKEDRDPLRDVMAGLFSDPAPKSEDDALVKAAAQLGKEESDESLMAADANLVADTMEKPEHRRAQAEAMLKKRKNEGSKAWMLRGMP